MTSDLNNELRNRLKSSEHATVTNLRKSCTTSDTKLSLETDQTATATATTTLHDDTVSLVRNLSSLGKLPTERRLASSSGGDGNDNETEIASTSEGESSGGREISEIIKNSAIARRRKLADGQFKANVKNNFNQPQLPPPPLLLPPLPTSTAQFWPYNKQFMSNRQKQQYRHVEAPKAKAFIENNL